jgi:2-dehydro-3-deoxyphosphogluconate aldolase/(4S)-4-hydroxy-2-oxoglutarate aldolase
MLQTVNAILKQAPMVPVITINDPNTAVPLAKALKAGGLPVLEVTLRTPYGLEAITRIKNEVEGVVVGAGTVLSIVDLGNAVSAGSEFIVTPGLTDNLLAAGADCGVGFLPGIATVSELMRAMEKGITTLKFFPAEANGGAKALASFGGPFPEVRFCPTGGIGLTNMAGYLALRSVLSVGGSWVCPDKLIASSDWSAITALARTTCQQISEIKQGATT